MSLYGVELNSQVNRLIFDIRLHLARNKHAPNVRTIYKSFAQLDTSITGEIPTFNFEKALNENGFFFKKYDLRIFEQYFVGKPGFINWFKFLGHLRESMGPYCRELINLIFNSLDEQKAGKVLVAQLMSRFNPAEIESFKFGKKSREVIENEMVGLINVVQGFVTKEEFIAFYDDLNVNFTRNETFARYVSEQWHFTPAKMEAAKEEQVKQAIKALRFKLIQKSQGTKDQLIIRKLFQVYDRNGNLYLGPYELDCMMKQLGVIGDPILVETVLARIDKNQSGFIEFEEFKKFLYYDPYSY